MIESHDQIKTYLFMRLDFIIIHKYGLLHINIIFIKIILKKKVFTNSHYVQIHILVIFETLFNVKC